MQRFESIVHLFMWFTKRGINYKHGAVALEDVKLPFTVGIEKSRLGNGVYNIWPPLISSKQEPLIDVSDTGKGIKIVAELRGVKKEHIKINVHYNSRSRSYRKCRKRKS
jgi:hypothetical protein